MYNKSCYFTALLTVKVQTCNCTYLLVAGDGKCAYFLRIHTVYPTKARNMSDGTSTIPTTTLANTAILRKLSLAALPSSGLRLAPPNWARVWSCGQKVVGGVTRTPNGRIYFLEPLRAVYTYTFSQENAIVL